MQVVNNRLFEVSFGREHGRYRYIGESNSLTTTPIQQDTFESGQKIKAKPVITVKSASEIKQDILNSEHFKAFSESMDEVSVNYKPAKNNEQSFLGITAKKDNINFKIVLTNLSGEKIAKINEDEQEFEKYISKPFNNLVKSFNETYADWVNLETERQKNLHPIKGIPAETVIDYIKEVKSLPLATKKYFDSKTEREKDVQTKTLALLKDYLLNDRTFKKDILCVKNYNEGKYGTTKGVTEIENNNATPISKLYEKFENKATSSTPESYLSAPRNRSDIFRLGLEGNRLDDNDLLEILGSPMLDKLIKETDGVKLNIKKKELSLSVYNYINHNDCTALFNISDTASVNKHSGPKVSKKIKEIFTNESLFNKYINEPLDKLYNGTSNILIGTLCTKASTGRVSWKEPVYEYRTRNFS